eukprot:3663683-Amphidinium_carterae.2
MSNARPPSNEFLMVDVPPLTESVSAYLSKLKRLQCSFHRFITPQRGSRMEERCLKVQIVATVSLVAQSHPVPPLPRPQSHSLVGTKLGTHNSGFSQGCVCRKESGTQAPLQ